MTTLDKFDSYEDYLDWFWRARPAKTPFCEEEFYRSLRYSGKGGNPIRLKGYEAPLLCRLLEESGLVYEAARDHILIPFSGVGSDIIEDDVEIDLISTWGDDFITIQLVLMELDESEQGALDPALLAALLQANYVMDICKFGFSPYGLSLLVDFDARNLQREEIESGILSILGGLELYVTILTNWLAYIQQTMELDFQDIYEPYWVEYAEEQKIVNLQNAEGNRDTSLKTQIIRGLVGVAKVGIGGGVLAAIAETVGVPAAITGSILAAVAGGSRGQGDQWDQLYSA